MAVDTCWLHFTVKICERVKTKQRRVEIAITKNSNIKQPTISEKSNNKAIVFVLFTTTTTTKTIKIVLHKNTCA